MKELLAVVAIALSVLVIYTVHQDRVRKAAADAEAAAIARSQAFKWKKPAPPPDRPAALAISHLLEPKLLDLFGALDQEYPADLVPPLEILKERLLDKRQHFDAAKKTVYDQGVRTIDLMIAAAEERTSTLDAVLRIAARAPAALDARNTGTNSNIFFLRTALKRWDSTKGQRKAAIDQSLAELRKAEREWNKTVGEKAMVEDYDIGSLPPVFVKIDQTESLTNPLERGAYDQRRQTYSWRRSYYDQYNQRSVYGY